MSTGLECLFDEVGLGEWWYVLENRFEDDDEPGDWMESADAYGPFATFDLAHDDLSRNHANPGGFTVARWHEGKGKPDAHMRRLMEEAGARDDRSQGSTFSFR